VGNDASDARAGLTACTLILLRADACADCDDCMRGLASRSFEDAVKFIEWLVII
jgi:hypothetical protein